MLGGGGSGRRTGPPKVTNIAESLDVGVPVSVAYDQWTQFAEFPKFMKGVESVEPKSETEQNWRVKIFKSRRTWKATTTEQIPDRRIAWTSEGGKGSTKGVVTFHPLADDLTRILLVMEYYPSGLMEKVGNIWRAGGRRIRLDLKHFRRFVAIQGEATGSWRGEIRDGELVANPQDASEQDATRQDQSGTTQRTAGTDRDRGDRDQSDRDRGDRDRGDREESGRGADQSGDAPGGGQTGDPARGAGAEREPAHA